MQQRCQQCSGVLEELLRSLTVVLLQVAGLVVGPCLAKMPFLLPTASVGGVWDEEKVIIPQKGKCTAIFQFSVKLLNSQT